MNTAAAAAAAAPTASGARKQPARSSKAAMADAEAPATPISAASFPVPAVKGFDSLVQMVL